MCEAAAKLSRECSRNTASKRSEKIIINEWEKLLKTLCSMVMRRTCLRIVPYGEYRGIGRATSAQIPIPVHDCVYAIWRNQLQNGHFSIAFARAALRCAGSCGPATSRVAEKIVYCSPLGVAIPSQFGILVVAKQMQRLEFVCSHTGNNYRPLWMGCR